MSSDSTTTSDYPPPVSQLLTYGDPRKLPPWPEKLDYLPLGFGPEHIPELIRMATDDELLWADSESLEVWATIHAWRTLGQLRAEAAIEPLLSLFRLVDDEDDDWIGEEMPEVFGLIGPAAIPALLAYVLAPEHGCWAQVAAEEAIKKVAETHPDAKPACIAALMEALAQYEDNDQTLNAFIISSLVDLRAAQAAQLMERAFAADTVDLSVAGDWEEAQIEMGWKIKRETPIPAGGWWAAEERRDGSTLADYRSAQPQPRQVKSTPQKAKAKAKRKQAAKSRKRNRRK